MNIIDIVFGRQQLDELLAEGKPILLDHCIQGCHPCKVLKSLLKTLVSKYPNVIFETLDAEATSENLAYAEEEEICQFPTMFLYNSQGELVDRDVFPDKDSIIEALEEVQ